jgi:hypothetical protein
MNGYRQFVAAAEIRDERTLARLIREHPELHNQAGEEGSLVDIIRHHCPELFSLALAAGLSPDAGPAPPHQTLLQMAVCDSDLELARLCRHHGAEVERRNCEDETALGYAAAWGTLETVRLLMEAGADANAIEGRKTDLQSTALDAAYNRPEIWDYLRQQGAKPWKELKPLD